MHLSSRRVVVIGVVLLALAFHLAIVWQDFGVLARNGFLYDDSFYDFKIAQNIAEGRGATFDGTTPTNGFQPLYVFLLVPVYWVAGSDLIAPIHVALSLSALFTALTALLLYGIVRRYVSHKIALVTAAVWAFSPVVLRQSANGLETSLALFLFAAVVLFYLNRIRGEDRPPIRDFLVLGALLGLAVLGRIDEVFLALALLLDYLLVLRKRRSGARVLVKIGLAVLAAIIVYSPWLIYSYIGMGSVFQDSGSATRFLSLAYAPFFELGSSEMATTGPTAGFVWAHVLHSVSVLKVSPPVYAFFRCGKRLDDFLGVSGAAEMILNVLGILLIFAFLYVVLFRKRGPAFERVNELRFLLLFAFVFMAAYSLYVFGVFFFIRYLYPIYFIATIYAAFFLDALFRRLGTRAGAARVAAVGALTAYAVVYAYMVYASAFRSTPVYQFYDVARWIEKNTSADDTIGVFQGGAIGYLSNRRVVNLDGKVNREALVALKNRSLQEYISRERIDVVLDDSKVLNLFLGEYQSDVAKAQGIEQIMNGTEDGLPGWAGYRFSGVDGTPGTGTAFSAPSASSSR